MLLSQADPDLDPKAQGTETHVSRHAQFRPFLNEVHRQTILSAPLPVLFVHGDTHVFQINKPFRTADGRFVLSNFTRLGTFGSPEAHWVQVTVSGTGSNVFSYTPRVVQANDLSRFPR